MAIKKASEARKKPLKILLFGDSGCGKTHFALQSTPKKILMFDAESGSDFFEGRKGFDFDYWTDDDGLKTASIKELTKAIDYLETAEGRKNYDTFIIDPISDIWDNIQAQRLDYKDNQLKKRGKEKLVENRNEAELESFNVKDWGDMKRIYKNMMLKLKNLPQNIILIAREKEISETKPDGSVVRTGEYTYEAEKNTKYAVDFTVRLIYDEKTKKRIAHIQKTRNDSYAKGDKIEPATFAMFDKVVNSMANAKEVERMSEKEENIFIEAEQSEPEVSEENIKDIIAEINGIAAEKAKINRDAVMTAIKEFHATGNPNGIKDMEIAKQVLAAVKELEV